jgi:hypothetical protein
MVREFIFCLEKMMSDDIENREWVAKKLMQKYSG